MFYYLFIYFKYIIRTEDLNETRWVIETMRLVKLQFYFYHIIIFNTCLIFYERMI